MSISLTLAEQESGVFLTSQEKAFCKGVAQGQPPAIVAKTIGLTPQKLWMDWMERKDITHVLALLKHQVDQFMGVEVTRELLNTMLFEAHATSATSMEKIAAVRELGKMNGVYAPEKKEITLQAVTKVEQLESMTDAELVERAGFDVTLKNREPVTIEHEA